MESFSEVIVLACDPFRASEQLNRHRPVEIVTSYGGQTATSDASSVSSFLSSCPHEYVSTGHIIRSNFINNKNPRQWNTWTTMSMASHKLSFTADLGIC